MQNGKWLENSPWEQRAAGSLLSVAVICLVHRGGLTSLSLGNGHFIQVSKGWSKDVGTDILATRSPETKAHHEQQQPELVLPLLVRTLWRTQGLLVCCASMHGYSPFAADSRSPVGIHSLVHSLSHTVWSWSLTHIFFSILEKWS